MKNKGDGFPNCKGLRRLYTRQKLKSIANQEIAVRMSNQCCAFTKKRARCKKKIVSNKVCQYHENYYEQWLETHPPLQGWRLDLEEKEEYKFQIENGHVTITEEYVKNFENSGLSDYYEYLTHLPHIGWDTNIRMVRSLLFSFIGQYESIIDIETVEYYFGRMIRNPSFCPAVMIARLIFVMDYKYREKPNSLRNISDIRKQEIFTALLQHPCFQGWFYMNWLEKLHKNMAPGKALHIFADTLSCRKDAWRKNRKECQTVGDELLEVALHPTRCLDWYLDWENKKEIRQFFVVS